MSTPNQTVEQVTTYRINKYLSVTAQNCTLEGQGQAPYNGTDNCILTVSNIRPDGSSILIFNQTTRQYPFAEQNWFHFTNARKNIYFDNKVFVHPTGRPGVFEAAISFTTSPNYENTKHASSPIETTFSIVNENGLINDPTLRIVF